ncbi:MAG: type III toxin-antitoxin system ToxN/AbiQ family toxin [Lachnospiraceae bacterium]|nr:type III toxin-antitoxin system ToxN/AbiQ family toxin [Lachnospiraceae bacterium]
MTSFPLNLYRIDMKYIRNLHHIDDRIMSVSPQAGKDERPFLGVIILYNHMQYCVPLSRPKAKHKYMKNKIDFKKMEYDGELLGVLNFNLMIPVERAQLTPIDTIIRKHDVQIIQKRKALLQKELNWCNEHACDICNTANVLYRKYLSGEKFSARTQCVNFSKLETECIHYNKMLPPDSR